MSTISQQIGCNFIQLVCQINLMIRIGFNRSS
nr:MAG TPA: hypothetical protein [Caudoviricetes sp.]